MASADVFESMPFTTQLQHATTATSITDEKKCCNSTSVATVARNHPGEGSIPSARISLALRIKDQNTDNPEAGL
jgi:hypothetical protein